MNLIHMTSVFTLRRNEVVLIVNKELHPKCNNWVQPLKWQNDLSSFPRETIQHHSNPNYALTIFSKEAESDEFYEDLQHLLELTPEKDILFIIGNWNARLESQEIPGITGKFGLGIQMKQGKG